MRLSSRRLKGYPALDRRRGVVPLRPATLAWICFARHRTHAAPPVIFGNTGSESRLRVLSARPYDCADRAPLQEAVDRNETQTPRKLFVMKCGVGTRPDTVGPETCRHGNVRQIIIRPNFGQATALLNCEKDALRWPGPFGLGFLSPQPPGVVGIGPVRRKVKIQTCWTNESWSFFFLGRVFFTRCVRGRISLTTNRMIGCAVARHRSRD